MLFGTPSNGLYKGELLSFWKRQIHDMADDSPFIKDLRQRWEKEIGDEPPFEFLVVAGDRDEFVPASSSLSPFPKAVQAVVPGSHVTIVNPNNKMDLSVEVVVKQLVGESAPAGPWNSARVAVEKRNFQHAIDTLWPNRDELDDASLVLLALALESVDREEDSIAVLQNTRQETTDVLGVLAGRLKRRWLEEGLLKDAQRAQALYKQALEEAEANGDGAQGFYHAINVAFMDLAFDKNLENARGNARRAIDYCDRSYRDAWCLATYGEAYLVLGEDDSSIDYYRQTLKKSPEVWQISSMYHQATAVAGLLNNQAMDDRLEALFRGDVS